MAACAVSLTRAGALGASGGDGASWAGLVAWGLAHGRGASAISVDASAVVTGAVSRWGAICATVGSGGGALHTRITSHAATSRPGTPTSSKPPRRRDGAFTADSSRRQVNPAPVSISAD